MTEISLNDLGIQKNPFESIIADEESAFKYTLYGRETEIERFSEFIREATVKETQQRVMVMGEYGTGKTHHLLHLMHDIDSGTYGEQYVGVYLGSLGISFRRLYEIIIQKTGEKIPELNDLINKLENVEPGDSVERTYAPEKLRDNIIQNLGILIAGARNCGINGIFLLIDEAEDIVQSDSMNDIQYFVQCLLHLINTLQGTPLHIIMGFSLEAMSRITVLEGNGTEERKLGDAFLQRFPNKIQLGYLSDQDARLMILDRLNSVRFTRSDTFYPIKPDVIDVVSRLVSGHPREILAIMDQALREAVLTGEREITGTQIIQILSKHESYYSKSFILDWNGLNSLTEGICAKNPSLGEDFRRLSGKLLGEDGAVNENDFMDIEFPELLTQPVSGVRILERRNTEFGETEYVIHPDVKNEVFKEKRYDSEIELAIEREIIDLVNFPEKYQNQLTHGLWKIFQTGWKVEYNSQLEIGSSLAIIGNVKTSSSTTPVSVLFTSYMGSTFPEELFMGIVQALESRQAGFAYVLYDGPRLSADAHYTHFKNNLRESEKERYLGDILTVSADNLQLEKNQIMGQVKYLGNRDIKLSDDINPANIFELLGAETKLTTLIDTRALIYPEERVRSVVNYFADNNLRSFNIKDLKSELSSDLYIDGDFLTRLEKQHFIRKNGGKWQIAQLDDGPLWKPINLYIRNNGPSTTKSIREHLEEQYVFQCPKGDENAMVGWYIQILLNLAIIESVPDNIEPLYKIIDHSKQLEILIGEAESEIKEINELIKAAEPMQIPLVDYKSKKEGFQVRIGKLKDTYSYIGNAEVLRCIALLTDITEFRGNLSRGIKKNQKEQSSRYDHVKTQVDLITETITDACKDGYLTENERNDWLKALDSELSTAESALKKKEYSALAISLNAAEQKIKSNKKLVDERKQSKQPCIDYSTKVSEQIGTTSALFTQLHDLGYENESFNERFIEASFKYKNDFTTFFNAGRFTDAKLCISNIHSELTTILSKLRQKNTEYANNRERISSARFTALSTDDELMHYINQADEAFAKWDFAQVETQLSLFEKKRKEKEDRILPEDKFRESFKDHALVKIDQVKNTYSIEEIFRYVKALYLKGEIENIEIHFK